MINTIARPYAKAIFKIAVESDSIEYWLSMLKFISIILSNNQIKNLYSGLVINSNLQKILLSLSNKYCNSFGINLIKLILKNKRFNIVPYVLKQFIDLNNEKNNICEIKIISAYKLNKLQLETICNVIKKKLLCNVSFVCIIDKKIISGIIIYIKDSIIDCSIKGYLKNLSEFLKINF
ncbi:MAG: F0F1 ATP synthase subunit delta [Enterobacterales bacterium]